MNTTETTTPRDDADEAEALFVSLLQPSQEPTADQVSAAIVAAIITYGCQGCAARVAAEFGEHPDAAAARMQWVLSRIRPVTS